MGSVADAPVTVTSEGHMTWARRARLATMCYIDLEYYPFGQQQCEIRLGSQSYSEAEVVIENTCL